MAVQKFDIFKDRAEAYLNVNAVDFTALRGNLEAPGNEKFRKIFQAELALARAGKFAQNEFENLTELEFETPQEFTEFLDIIEEEVFGAV